MAELVAARGHYQSKLGNALSFLLFSFATTGPILMMWFYPASYRMSLLDRGKSIDYVNRVMVSPDLATITWFVPHSYTGCWIRVGTIEHPSSIIGQKGDKDAQ